MQNFCASTPRVSVGVTSLMLLPVLYFYTNLVNNVFSLQLTLLEVLISTQLTIHQRNHHECKCSLCKSAIQFLLTLNKSLKFRSNVAESWNLTLVWPPFQLKRTSNKTRSFSLLCVNVLLHLCHILDFDLSVEVKPIGQLKRTLWKQNCDM